MYKQAIQQKLRFSTTKGTLSTEQLFDLDIKDLDTLAIQLDKEYNESGKKSFVVKKSVKDKTAKLKFDIVLDVLTTKVDERDAAQEAAEIKKHNEKILGLIAEKQEGQLKGKSIRELEKMLK